MTRARWGTNLGFMLAAVGSAIGLGNVWKFPYMAGVNGGGAFVLVYLFCIAIVGIPILIAEIYIGQKSQANAIHAYEYLDKKNSPWQFAGWLSVIASFLFLSFYSVVGGWVLDFEFNSLINTFSDMSSEEIEGALGGLFGSASRLIFWHAVFMALVIGIVYMGVESGLERWNKILMPALFGLLALLFIKAMTLEGFGPALSFLFIPDFSALTGLAILDAIGHSFFTLSLSLGTMITYGSYLASSENLPRLALTVAFMDTLIALVAGTVVFSIVFSFGMNPGEGPGLVFSTLPSLFVQMTGGYFLSVIFFLLLTFAALTSAVSILEPSVAFVCEKFKATRMQATLGCGIATFFTGVLCALSFNHLSEFKIIGLNIFDLFDKLAANWLMPVAGMVTALFLGWQLGRPAIKDILKQVKIPYVEDILLWLARIVAPVGIFIILLRVIFG